MTSYTLLLTKIVILSLFRSSLGSRDDAYELRISTPLNSTEINEGDDFYFKCEVINPGNFNEGIGWAQDGTIIIQNISRGITYRDEYLYLDKVDFNSKGNYSCFSTTEVGIVSSELLFLNVRVKPETPFNCSSYSMNASIEIVTCLPGYDGGLPQSFSLEFRRFNSTTLKYDTVHIKNDEPSFLVPGLENNRNYMALIVASNKIGRSREFTTLSFFHSSEQDEKDGDVHGAVEKQIRDEDSTQNAKQFADEMLELQRQISADVKRLADTFEGARTTLAEDLNRIINRLG